MLLPRKPTTPRSLPRAHYDLALSFPASCSYRRPMRPAIAPADPFSGLVRSGNIKRLSDFTGPVNLPFWLKRLDGVGGATRRSHRVVRHRRSASIEATTQLSTMTINRFYPRLRAG